MCITFTQAPCTCFNEESSDYYDTSQYQLLARLLACSCYQYSMYYYNIYIATTIHYYFVPQQKIGERRIIWCSTQFSNNGNKIKSNPFPNNIEILLHMSQRETRTWSSLRSNKMCFSILVAIDSWASHFEKQAISYEQVQNDETFSRIINQSILYI